MVSILWWERSASDVEREAVMAWGMEFRSRFGEFFPDGCFEADRKTKDPEFYNRLRVAYTSATPEEQIELCGKASDNDYSAAIEYTGYVFDRLRYGTSCYLYGQPFRTLKPHEVPKSFDLAKTYKTLGAMIELNDLIVAVDNYLKDLMEEMEPGIHGFIPIPILTPRKVPFPKNYFILVVNQNFIGAAEVESNKRLRDVTATEFKRGFFGNAHLWRERHFRENAVFFSDELMTEINKRGLRVPKCQKIKEV
jgi:hypothetical protein